MREKIGNFLESIKKSIFFKIVILTKRLIFYVVEIFAYCKNGISWLFNSSEHTSFSLSISKESELALTANLSEFLSLDKNKLKEMIEFSKNLKKESVKFKNYKFYDVDLQNKFDYRLLPFLIFFQSNISHIFEFGFNQARLPYLLHKYEEETNKKVQYVGVDFNPRKGALECYIESDNYAFYYEDVAEFLSKGEYSDKINNSIFIVSTHEAKSEKIIFDYLNKLDNLPKIIISDEVGSKSPYMDFIKNGEYKNTLFSFTDINHFLKPLHIGLSVLKN
jgi:hypothetical protein